MLSTCCTEAQKLDIKVIHVKVHGSLGGIAKDSLCRTSKIREKGHLWLSGCHSVYILWWPLGYEVNTKDVDNVCRHSTQRKQKPTFTFRLMSCKRSLCLLGVGYYFLGQEIHLGDLGYAQLVQSSSVSSKGQTLRKAIWLFQKTRQLRNHKNKPRFPQLLRMVSGSWP